jgi:serine/threonine-protein kinase HipA
MRQAIIKYSNIQAGVLSELDSGEYQFLYDEFYIQNYPDLPITFQMPISTNPFRSKRLFP